MHSSRMHTACSLTIWWRGACVAGGVCVAGDMRGRGGLRGGGHACQRGMHGGAGVRGRGHAWQVGGVHGMHVLPVDRMTDSCKNITLPQTLLRTVINYRLDTVKSK